MNPKITVIAEGDKVDASEIKRALEGIPGVKVTPMGLDRGLLQKGLKALDFATEFAGGPTVVADGLIKIAGQLTKGATIKIMLPSGGAIELTNIRRSDVIAALETSTKVAKAASSL